MCFKPGSANQSARPAIPGSSTSGVDPPPLFAARKNTSAPCLKSGQEKDKPFGRVSGRPPAAPKDARHTTGRRYHRPDAVDNAGDGRLSQLSGAWRSFASPNCSRTTKRGVRRATTAPLNCCDRHSRTPRHMQELDGALIDISRGSMSVRHLTTCIRASAWHGRTSGMI